MKNLCTFFPVCLLFFIIFRSFPSRFFSYASFSSSLVSVPSFFSSSVSLLYFSLRLALLGSSEI